MSYGLRAAWRRPQGNYVRFRAAFPGTEWTTNAARLFASAFGQAPEVPFWRKSAERESILGDGSTYRPVLGLSDPSRAIEVAAPASARPAAANNEIFSPCAGSRASAIATKVAPAV